MNNQDKTPEGITPNLPLWSYKLQQDSKLAVKTRKDLEIHLITCALKNEGFRQELITNPKAVVEKQIGTKLPEELEIKVLEETEDTLYMVLPCNPYEGISEEELKVFLGMTYEDVARWVLEQQRNALLSEENSVKLMVQAWRDQEFKNKLLLNPKIVIQQELASEIPSSLSIQIQEETANSLYIIIPSILENFEVYNLGSEVSNLNMPIVIGSGGVCQASGRCFTSDRTSGGLSCCIRF
ncbi:NHLP leader peptide family RiPP precursor [Nostoc sp. CENA67]|uniref:NHLP leader peptide family RiPP n=1 Tax=Amazonocrinis nigriterrae CENA67 TaxID=2794033 RepID=A0A8J7L7F2_9NOST|nr:NHLP leader peptide family RiPP precursor [Amazonocrinis nigriterrae]MBH8562238.1 NHLP leader peptide family RiPP precursor [Amazonocrinis nigriterrae CENA67]